MIKVTTKTKNPVVLTLKMFNKMLCLPSANKTLQLVDADAFLASQAGGSNVLRDFLLPSANIPTDLSTIDITLLQEPYRDFSWLFSHVVGRESTSHIPRSALYALYFSFHKDAMFDWEEVISNELCFQLSNYFSTQIFFMAAYLVFTIVFCNFFDSLPVKETVNIHNEPVQFWHPVLCKHKAPFNFCIVQDKFVREFRHILVGAEPKRITQEAEYFLKGKGICIQEKNHTYICLYGCQENPLLLPIFVCDRYFVVEVFRQYKSWCILFDRKRKKQFITLPLRVGDTMVRNLAHLKQVSETLNLFNLKEAQPLGGFDPEGMFSDI
jgi:hypothetical protein